MAGGGGCFNDSQHLHMCADIKEVHNCVGGGRIQPLAVEEELSSEQGEGQPGMSHGVLDHIVREVSVNSYITNVGVGRYIDNFQHVHRYKLVKAHIFLYNICHQDLEIML